MHSLRLLDGQCMQIEVSHLKFKGAKSISAYTNWNLHNIDPWDLCEDKLMNMHRTHNNSKTGKTCPSQIVGFKTPSKYHYDYRIIMCPHGNSRLSLEVTAACQQVAHWSASPATATERTTRASAI